MRDTSASASGTFLNWPETNYLWIVEGRLRLREVRPGDWLQHRERQTDLMTDAGSTAGNRIVQRCERGRKQLGLFDQKSSIGVVSLYFSLACLHQVDIGGAVLGSVQQSEIVTAPDDRSDRHLPSQLEFEESSSVQGSATGKLAQDRAARKKEGAREPMRLVLSRAVTSLHASVHDEVSAFMSEVEPLAAQTFLE